MQNILKGLEPECVFKYFEEISSIPRGSGNTKKISDYCYGFAKRLGLECKQDIYDNVIIIKEAAKGYENSNTVMLQGHIDMVCEKVSERKHDFEKNGLELIVNNGYVEAVDTTLGADDGIAVAYMLAILADEKIKHPRLECVFTADEETGMYGAIGIDLTASKAKYMINLDSEEEGIFLAGCAGGISVKARLPLKKNQMSGNTYSIIIKGLKGGHSGDEIHKGRVNAVKLAARLVNELLNSNIEIGLVSINGGLKGNAIPREAQIIFKTTETLNSLKAFVESRLNIYKSECKISDPDLTLELEEIEGTNNEAVDEPTLNSILMILNATPNGVQEISIEIPGFVETSLNLGILKMDKNELNAEFSIRSSVASQKEMLKDKLKFLIEYAGAKIDVCGDYPGWNFKKESKLRSIMCSIWKEMYAKEAVVKTIHAGLECGLILEKLPEIDIVSLGPDILDIHTPQERLSIASTERCYNFVVKVLENLK